MALVAIAIYLLAILFKAKRKKFLVIIMAGVLAVGLGGLYYVQYFFSNHYYTQEIEPSTIESIKFDDSKIKNIKNLLDDYEKKTTSDQKSTVYQKVYQIDNNNSSSTIQADIYVFSDISDADNYFSAEQNLYDNKNYIPLDPLKSKRKGNGTLYLLSGIKSQYRDYTELLYLPNRIDYCSDLVIKSENVIVSLSETCDNATSNKDQVISDIASKLNKN